MRVLVILNQKRNTFGRVHGTAHCDNAGHLDTHVGAEQNCGETFAL